MVWGSIHPTATMGSPQSQGTIVFLFDSVHQLLSGPICGALPDAFSEVFNSWVSTWNF